MKKIISILFVAMAFTSMCYAQQKPNVNKAKNMAFAVENPDYNGAKAIIEEAIKNEELNKLAKTWFVAGEVYYQACISNTAEGSEIANGEDAALAFKYFQKAYELDNMPNEKGKVNPKYGNKIKDYMVSLYHRYTLVNYGVKEYELHEYAKAIEAFETHTDILDLPMVAGQKNVPLKDTAYYEIIYYTAQCAWAGNLNQKAISVFSKLKGKGYKENEVYQSLVQLYNTEKDTTNFLMTLEEGIAKFPNEFYYLGNLINHYIFNKEYNKAKDYLEKAIANDPNNAQYYVVLSSVMEEEKDIENAIKMIDKAIELDNTNPEAWYNKGRLIYNQAVVIDQKASEITDFKQADIVAKQAHDKYKESLPYFEKAVELKPTDIDYLRNLRSLYYRFQDEDAKYTKLYDELTNKINSL